MERGGERRIAPQKRKKLPRKCHGRGDGVVVVTNPISIRRFCHQTIYFVRLATYFKLCWHTRFSNSNVSNQKSNKTKLSLQFLIFLTQIY
jgi:hypothetical protein